MQRILEQIVRDREGEKPWCLCLCLLGQMHQVRVGENITKIVFYQFHGFCTRLCLVLLNSYRGALARHNVRTPITRLTSKIADNRRTYSTSILLTIVKTFPSCLGTLIHPTVMQSYKKLTRKGSPCFKHTRR